MAKSKLLLNTSTYQKAQESVKVINGAISNTTNNSFAWVGGSGNPFYHVQYSGYSFLDKDQKSQLKKVIKSII